MDFGESLELVGLSHLADDLARAARSPAPLLLIGSAGSGRTWLARRLHEQSPRAGGPLVEVDPLLVPSALFDSELFGHRRGAFTGAVEDRKGRVALAEGGSLLVDRLEELPSEVQVKLLRLIAEGEYTPLGGRQRRADVRFLAAASPQLHDRVRRGLFRRDLLYRLEVLVFELPELGARALDWERLARALLAEAGERLGLEVPETRSDTLRSLGARAWPGNLTQLRSVLDRALLQHEGPGPLRLPLGERHEEPRPRSLRQAEHEAILRALAYARGNQTQAAEILGISRKSLWERRKRLGIP
ncbi:MAG: sigma-54-dependent Fis family transcriptional regulator [Acidobacteria bacterium]|nr:MAG: sigma-54-dependent Fis family transcriptional regulator [Acidobacteriota bacterium]REK00545.1 MAG: sigma-54-dependent Fis family transcriptional regulator [Acidobacteriota bacterium]